MSETEQPAAPPKRRRKLWLAAPVAVLAAAGGLWFSGTLPGWLAGRPKPAPAALAASYLDVPEIITNLNVPGRRQSYLKLHAQLELPGGEDPAPVTAAMPRLLDLFQTYLRDMRPEELRGSEGSYRLREALLARAGIAVAPARVDDVLFIEMVIE